MKYLLIALVLLTPLVSADVFNTYKTAILVNDTDANDPLKLSQAFAQIIAKSTGEELTTIIENPVFATAKVTSGIKHSYFEKIDHKFLARDSLYRYWFNLVMNEDFVKQIIQQAGFSVLPNNRKKIMLWVVSEQDVLEQGVIKQVETEELRLSYAYDNEVIMYWINQWSIALGVRLFSPTIDEVDMANVSPFSIKNLSFEANNQSQARYNIDMSLSLFISKLKDDLKIRSGYEMPGKNMEISHYQNKAESLDDLGVLMYSAIVNVAQIYANHYKVAVEDIQKHTVQLVIDSFGNYDDVNVTIKYLTAMSVIESFEIVSASVGTVVLTTELAISNEAFFKIIARDNILQVSNKLSINQLVLSFVNSE